MEKVIKTYHSFEDQEADDTRYWQYLPGEKKLEILELIRANYWAMKDESPGRLQRVYRIVERTSG